METVAVAAVQMESVLGDVQTNAARMRDWMGRAAKAGANLVFFPECCLTGYSTARADEAVISSDAAEAVNLEKYACELGIAVGYGYIEQRGSRDAAAGHGSVERHASKGAAAGHGFIGRRTSKGAAAGHGFIERRTSKGAAAGHGFIERRTSKGIAAGHDHIERRESTRVERFLGGVSGIASPAKPYVTYVVAGQEGRLVYRKTHLGSKEQHAFAAGDELPVARIAGVDVGVQLCWEAHIPDITTTLRAKGAELVLVPHAVGVGGEKRAQLWDRYLPARAYDNGLFVVACNALRRDEGGSLVGGGVVAYGPDGVCLGGRADAQEGMSLACVGGELPRETGDGGMHGASYFDRRRPELYL